MRGVVRCGLLAVVAGGLMPEAAVAQSGRDLLARRWHPQPLLRSAAVRRSRGISGPAYRPSASVFPTAPPTPVSPRWSSRPFVHSAPRFSDRVQPRLPQRSARGVYRTEKHWRFEDHSALAAEATDRPGTSGSGGAFGRPQNRKPMTGLDNPVERNHHRLRTKDSVKAPSAAIVWQSRPSTVTEGGAR